VVAHVDEPEEEEEVDLLALQSTPEAFLAKDCNVMAYELNSLSTRYTKDEIAAVQQLRHRQLHVQVQQLAHHVSANTDHLTAGIATCRSIGKLLRLAGQSSTTARAHWQAAEQATGSSLRATLLHQQSCALSEMLRICSSVAEARRLTAVAEELLLSAQSGDAYHQGERAQALLLALEELSSHLHTSSMAPLKLQSAMLARCQAIQRDLRGIVAAMLLRVCCSFDAISFEQVLSLHVMDKRAGADLPASIRQTFASLVTSTDSSATHSADVSLLQKLIMQEILTSYSKGDVGLTVLCRELPRTKLRSALELIMQRQFQWLQSYHAMQECVEDMLTEAKQTRAALESGHALVEWRSGLPTVVLRETAEEHVPEAGVDANAVKVAAAGLAGDPALLIEQAELYDDLQVCAVPNADSPAWRVLYLVRVLDFACMSLSNVFQKRAPFLEMLHVRAVFARSEALTCVEHSVGSVQSSGKQGP
jgi:ribosomal protein L17